MDKIKQFLNEQIMELMSVKPLVFDDTFIGQTSYR